MPNFVPAHREVVEHLPSARERIQRRVQPRHVLWCVTLYEPTREDSESFKSHVDSGYCIYFAGQCERCPTTERKHFQGWFALSVRRTLGGIKSVIFDSCHLSTAHLTPCLGTKEENRAYCSKRESRDPDAAFAPLEFGDFSACPERNGQGSRNDIASAAESIRDGGSLLEVATSDPGLYVKYYRGLIALQAIVRCVPRRWDPGTCPAPCTVRWYYGKSGSGKSRAAFTEGYSDALRPCYTKSAGNRWWCSYAGEPVVILDDYRSDWFTFGQLLRLIDVYPLQVETKGSQVQMCADTFIFTCPLRPEILYASLGNREDGRIQQLLRRITEIRLFGEEPDIPVPEPLAPGFYPLRN